MDNCIEATLHKTKKRAGSKIRINLKTLTTFFVFLSTLFIGADLFGVDVGVNLRLDQIFLFIATFLLIISNKYRIRRNASIIVFMVFTFISLLFAINHTRAIIFYFSIVFNVFLIMYMYSNYIIYYGYKKMIKMFRITCYTQFGILVMQYILKIFFNFEIPFMETYGYYMGIPRFRLWFHEPSFLGIYLIFWHALSWYMALINKNKSYIKDIVIGLVMLLITTSTSGYIGAAFSMAMVYIIWICRRVTIKKLLFPVIFIIIFIVFRFVFADVYNVFIGRLFSGSLNSASGGRIEAWKETIKVFKENIPFGCGPGCYGLYLGEDAGYVPSNVTLELLATLGIFSTIAFYSITVALVVRSYKCYKKYGVKLLNAMTFALIVFTLLLQINQGYLRLYHWMFFGMIDGSIRYFNMNLSKTRKTKIRRKGSKIIMKQLVINGKFLSQKITGVQRVAREVLKEISKFDDIKIIVAMPKTATIPDGDYPNTTFKVVGKHDGYYWEQFELSKYAKKLKAPLLNLCNIAPFNYKNSYTVLHDVTFKEKCDYIDKKWALRYKILVKLYINKIKWIFTVSNFSKGRIEHFYPKRKGSISVLDEGHEHFDLIVPKKVEGLPKEFYFSVGSVNPNKNFIYILNLAKNNPDKTFVITGNKNNSYEEFMRENNITNTIFTGYLEDGELKYLYQSCKGFILPSKYEGFGLPPLEAISAGCKSIYLSNLDVFKEIYGDVATFFDEYDYTKTVDLNNSVVITDEARNALLLKYSWKNTALQIKSKIFGEE